MPDWKEIVQERLAGIGLDGAREAEIVDEMAQHLEDRYNELLAAGTSEAGALRLVLEELSSERLVEDLRKARTPLRLPPALGAPPPHRGFLSGFRHDLKTALRAIRLKPAFSIMVIGMLALGIAGNAAIFSIFNGLFLKPLPFPDSERLVDLDETAPTWNLKFVGIAGPDYYHWRDGSSAFDGMACFDTSDFNLSGQGTARRVHGASVTYNLLDVLGLKPAIGRNILPQEDRPGGTKVALISDELWRQQFNGDRNVLGRILQLDKQAYTVVGVLPRKAEFPGQAQLWVPLQVDRNEHRGWYLNGVGRLKRGVTIERAQANLLSVHKATAIEKGATSPILMPLRDRYLGDFRAVSHALLGAVAIVLLIACVNIAALMLVRGSARAREIAIRTAIGASRARIVRQLFTENLVLAGIAAIVGIALGYACLQAMISLMPDDMPRWISFQMDVRFALFCTLVTGAAAVLFGLAPTVQASGVDTRSCLQDAAPRTSLSRNRRYTLSALVICEISLALVLLISAGLLVEAFRNVLHVDPGFRPENVITFRVSLPNVKYEKPEQRLSFFENLIDRLRVLPGVKAVGAASAPPLGGHWGNFFTVEGAPPLGPKEQNPVVLQVVVTPGYFDAIGITLLAGRGFNARDGNPQGPYVVTVNESFSKRYWPKPADAIGKRICHPGDNDKWMTVIGVTRDTRHYGLDQKMRPSVSFPEREIPDWDSMSIVLRSSISPQMLVAPARDALRQMDADLPMYQVQTMTAALDRSLWARRAYSWLFGAFAMVAMVLAAAGVYGVVSFAVSQRTHEIGIRMALGARPQQVLREVLTDGMTLVFIGTVLGLAGALLTARFLETLLFGVSGRDPVIYAAVILAVGAVGLAANFVPARRAAAIDPMRALRSE